MPRQPRPSLPLRHQTTRVPPATPTTHTGCRWEALVAKDGDAFVAHVHALTYECTRALFNDVSDEIRTVVFQESNMVAVAQEAHELATAYDGTDSAALTTQFFFLHAGLYVEDWHLGEALNWGPDVWLAIDPAVRAFFANPHANDVSDDAGAALVAVFGLVDGPNHRLRYLPAVVNWLSQWNIQRAELYEQRRAAQAVFTIIYNCHFELTGFEDTVAGLPIVEVLRDFALADWMLGTRAEYLQANGARELGRFLQYPELPFYAAVRAGVQEVLDRYDPLGTGVQAWAAAAGNVLHVGECEAFGICEELAGLEDTVLSVEHRCSDEILIRAQKLDEHQLRVACATLRRTEAAFHHRLNTRRQPVANDYTAAYQIIAFADWDNYDTYSYLFFGNDTDNGGIYFEGDPSEEGNIARHLGYVADWLPDRPIWNLAHEYVHYLDGRFNLLGGFEDAKVDTHKTIWWIEGLAEYVSMREDNENAVDLAQSSSITLETVLATTYDDGVDRVYRWSYLLVRLLFERHPAEIDRLLGFLRAGDYDGYLAHVNAGFAGVDDATWRSWLGEVEVLPDYEVATVRLPLPNELSTFDAETAQITINAAVAHRSGQAITVAAVSSDPEVVAVTTMGGRLTLTALAVGEVTIRVTVSDAWSSNVRQFTVAVTTECPSWLCRTAASWRSVTELPAEN